ncbi:MAG TPA: phosphate ABC transporter permease PstA [Candidatus Dormibacteraeota bacterium]|jgi:phosphate transport system permease protein|nr:phosphate ABC transporter permease PstA [Candidatus Dormibacteraeota bacterium]
MTLAIRGSAVFLVGMLAFIVIRLILAGLPELNLHFITSPPKALDPGGGIGPQLFNSVYVLVLSLLITAPIGLAAGVYLAELAPDNRFTQALSVATETLATLPSIVVGLFGLLVFVELTHWSFTRLGGALALTVINLPYAVRVTEDALRALPDSLREGSLGVGATRWQTIRKVLLPAALPSLITGLILISGRAFGEAAALLYTAGQAALRAHLTLDPFAPGETLAVHLFSYRQDASVPDVNQIADGTAAVLLIVVLAFNVGARFLGRVAVRRVTGK